jgi:hypothetical protein
MSFLAAATASDVANRVSPSAKRGQGFAADI